MRSSFVWFRAIVCLATALMMGISWPLWISVGALPRVTFVPGLREIPVWASWVRFTITILAMIAASLGIMPRRWLGCALILSLWMVLEDQFRLQPWMYQFLVMGFAIAVCSAFQASSLCRLFVIAMYFHSGVSKLDHAFLHETGYQFLSTASHWMGQDVSRWHPVATQAAIFMMPVWEIAVALALALRWNRLGVAGAIAQHLALVGLLGPWGLSHSLNVLLWNAALIPEVAILFFGRRNEEPAHRSPITPLAKIVVIAAAVLPFGEPFGYWDTWPSFGLYTSANERVSLEILRDEIEEWPKDIQQNIDLNPRDPIWVPIDLRLWSLRERRVPLYPSSRAMIGVAEAISARYGGPRAIRAVVLGRADRWNGSRTRIELLGRDAIHRHGDLFRLNAHPVL